jgi:hypothetical protein
MSNYLSACNIVRIDINRDEDWDDEFPQFLNPDGTPFDFTQNNASLELWLRPTFDYPVAIERLTSADAISFSDGLGGQDGRAAIYVPRDRIILGIPAGEWQQFLLLREQGAGAETAAYREIWRGALVCWPASSEPRVDISFNFGDPFSFGLIF